MWTRLSALRIPIANLRFCFSIATQTGKHPTHVLGFASNMHELMAKAAKSLGRPQSATAVCQKVMKRLGYRY
jgi:hypothetical protein